MADKFDKIQEAYFEKARRTKTWSGISLKEVYLEEDLSASTKEKIGLPGEYPYTRGIYRDMYRGRLWTRREVSGYGTPEECNARVRYLLEQGQTGINVITDLPSNFGVDSDHPLAQNDVGVIGMPYCSLPDMEKLLEGIPLDKVSITLIGYSSSAPVLLSQYVALAKKRGLYITNLRGTTPNDPFHHYYSGYHDRVYPIDIMIENSMDVVEFCTKNMPKWYSMNINMYNLREQGLTASQEIAFGLAIGIEILKRAAGRGLDLNQVARKIGFYCSAHIDIFEEAAKFRAARRMWATIKKERFGIRDPQALKFSFGVQTAGCSLVRQQPLNNAIRVAYEALGAVLGGVQSVSTASYLEPISLPTEEAHRLALRTQQILAYETGIANVTDPLGGSYFVESLTDKLEEEALKIIEEIESIGGMAAAVKKGWYQREIEKAAVRFQREVESGERLIVGTNIFTIPEEEDKEGEIHITPPGSSKKQVERIKQFKKERDSSKTRDALYTLYQNAQRRKEGERVNLIPFIISATEAYATLGEITGTIRMAYELPYDPLGVVEPPFSW